MARKANNHAHMSELRKDPIVGRWVIISTERAKRPTDFKAKKAVPRGGLCPFCPGNEDKTPPEILAYREEGTAPNSPGWRTRVVPNRFPALAIEGKLDRKGEGIYDRMNGIGAHEVIIESPQHDMSFASLPEKQIEDVLWAFRDRIVDLTRDTRLQYCLIFKNHGESAGSSMEHTHSQLIALPIVPRAVREELKFSKEYFDYKERCVWCDVLTQELNDEIRIIEQTESFVALSPYAPRFPFEAWILPRNHASNFEDSQRPEFADLAKMLKSHFRRLDRALDTPAFNFVLHTAPVRERNLPYFHWHIEVVPKLSNVGGFEWGSGFYINPTPPEEAAQFLREIKG
jgi:UDPglucose--hexose-1-phosphate uridylyltransferase